MKKIVAVPIQPTPFDDQVIYSQNDFILEVCMNQPSKRLAYQIRYRSYLEAGMIAENDDSLLYDKYDALASSRIFLVWYQGTPVATVRSSIYSDHYQWTPTEGVNYFSNDMMESLGAETPVLESSRFAVDPDFQGRQSLFARFLLFRAHGLNASLHKCAYITTAVRSKHLAFYKRFLNLNPISDNTCQIAWVDDEVYLLANRTDECLEAILKRGMPNYDAQDVFHYATCARLPMLGERQIVA